MILRKSHFKTQTYVIARPLQHLTHILWSDRLMKGRDGGTMTLRSSCVEAVQKLCCTASSAWFKAAHVHFACLHVEKRVCMCVKVCVISWIWEITKCLVALLLCAPLSFHCPPFNYYWQWRGARPPTETNCQTTHLLFSGLSWLLLSSTSVYHHLHLSSLTVFFLSSLCLWFCFLFYYGLV